VAYEALWEQEKASFKTLSELFTKNPGSRPSDFVDKSTIDAMYDTIKKIVLNDSLKYKINLLINGTFDYPKKLKDAKEPVEVLYYSGNLDLLRTKTIAIVGTRNPSPEGLKRTEKLVKLLVKEKFTIVSGLAMGIDTQAHKVAIQEKGKTIAVIGTPLDNYYPKENSELQKTIAKDYLLISQVPFSRYKKQGINGNRLFFPERNKTMSALSEATVIIEAGETSGTLIQAKAALFQRRKLFILESCFQNSKITWPERFLKLGAIKVKEITDITNVLC
jgi:DNA processing protein